ncbi:MAG: SurA N-terminal domain-containing protein [Myxococcota bacterium]|nr:SurA N-terminal domain-containing protein [Myxococcota bacterium]
MEEIGGWRVERLIANDGDVHEYAVSKDGKHAVMHLVAEGASSTLLHGATVRRTLVVRGKHEGRAFVVTTDAVRAKPQRSLALPLVVLALTIIGGGVLVSTLVRPAKSKPACVDCVLIVDGKEISSASFRMYASDPFLFPERKGEDKKRAALDLLIVRAVLHAEAVKKGITVTDVAERAQAAEFAVGLRTFDVREKLASQGETFEDATIDRYAKAVGLADRAALFAEMTIERMAIEVGGDHARACARAKVVVGNTHLAEPYRPCATL